MKRWWNYISKHNIWSKVAAGIITAILISIFTYLYSLIKKVSFLSILQNLFSFKISLGIYLIITIIGVTIFQIIKIKRKPSTPYHKEPSFQDSSKENPKIEINPSSASLNRNLIFDSNIVDEKAFSGYGQQIYDTPTRKLIGKVGSGTFHFKDKILTINRTNQEGRFIVPLTKYFFHGEALLFVPKYIYGKSPREIRVKISARAIRGIHRIIFVFRKKDSYDWINNTTTIIKEREWTNQVTGYVINSDEDFVLELHTYVDSQTPATLQIKDLFVEET